MGNILQACLEIANNPIITLVDHYAGRNRINNIGKALEIFVADAFAGTINETNEKARLRTLSNVYSYSGNQNNPPDLMLRNSDAIEVKKIQSANSSLALNSSYPKAKLFADSPMITQDCKNCEEWVEKDIIYAIGQTSDMTLKSLWMIYGDCYAADKRVYENIKQTISNGIIDIPDVDFTETKELGKVKRVDPLGITDLRIRGMWSIKNPNHVYDYVYTSSATSKFELIVIMKRNKYASFPSEVIHQIEQSDLLKINNIELKNPNNPSQLLDAKMITFKVD